MCLKNYPAWPPDLYEYWLEHGSMDELDLYDKIKHGTASHRDWVEKGGVGFNVDPLVILNAPKNEEINAVEKAA